MKQLTRDDLLAGKLFDYTGHFKIMSAEVVLWFKDGFLFDRASERYAMVLMPASDDHFFISKEGYGRILILFKECQLKQPKG